jgi:glycosyltransferase involved in cell wall biosynthesis
MISVVIPLYNKARYIKDTINSVLNQSFQDFEIVVIDDGSTDDGVKIIDNISDTRIKIIVQKNSGVSVARNRGVAESKYEYIAFLDGDDKWLPNYLEKMKEAIDIYPNAGMYCCAGIVRNADGSEFFRLAKKYKDRILEIDFFENPHVFLHTSATIVSKSFFNKTDGFPVGMKRNEDYALFFSLALISKVVYCGFPLSFYMGGIEGQATSDNSLEIQKHTINRYNYVFSNWLKTGCQNSSFKVFLKYELRHAFLMALREKNYEILNLYLSNLDPCIKQIFSKGEVFVMKIYFFNKISILFILCTKIKWRFNGYPVFGES